MTNPTDASVDPRRCFLHGYVKVQQFSGPYDPNSSAARLSWWECPKCSQPAEVPYASR